MSKHNARGSDTYLNPHNLRTAHGGKNPVFVGDVIHSFTITSSPFYDVPTASMRRGRRVTKLLDRRQRREGGKRHVGSGKR